MPNPSRNKGDREERAIVNLHKEWGILVQRTLESGKRPYGAAWDLDVLRDGKKTLKGECKVRGSGFKQIYDWMGENDFLTLRADNKERLYVIPEHIWKQFIQGEPVKNGSVVIET